MSLSRRVASTVDTILCTILFYSAVLVFVAINCFAVAIIYFLLEITL